MESSKLIQAVKAGDLTEARAHLDQVKMRNENGMTALMYAVKSSREMILLLVEDENRMRDSNSWTALMYAVWHGKLDAVKLLLCEAQMTTERTYKIGDLRFPPGMTALMLAACLGDIEAIKVLLPYEQRLFDRDGNNALYYATNYAYNRANSRLRPYGHPEAICLLKREFDFVYDPLPKKLTPLMEAILQEDILQVKLHLSETTSTDEVDVALRLAAERGYEEIAMLLIPKATRRGIKGAADRAILCNNSELGNHIQANLISFTRSPPPSLPVSESPMVTVESTPSPAPPVPPQESVSISNKPSEGFPGLTLPDYTTLSSRERNQLRRHVIRYLSALANYKSKDE